MTLDEWIWRKKLTIVDLAREINCAPVTISEVKKRRTNFNIKFILKMVALTEGQVPLTEFMTEQDHKELIEWSEKNGFPVYDKAI